MFIVIHEYGRSIDIDISSNFRIFNSWNRQLVWALVMTVTVHANYFCSWSIAIFKSFDVCVVTLSILIPCQHAKSSQTPLIALCFYRGVLHNKISDKFHIDLFVTSLNFDFGSWSNHLVSAIILSEILGAYQSWCSPHQYLGQVWRWPFCDLSDLGTYVK